MSRGGTRTEQLWRRYNVDLVGDLLTRRIPMLLLLWWRNFWCVSLLRHALDSFREGTMSTSSWGSSCDNPRQISRLRSYFFVSDDLGWVT